MSTSAELLGRKEMDRRPDPGKPELPGLQARGSNHGKTRLPGAADPDKSSILYHVFCYGLRYVKPHFPLSYRAPLTLGPRARSWGQVWS